MKGRSDHRSLNGTRDHRLWASTELDRIPGIEIFCKTGGAGREEFENAASINRNGEDFFIDEGAGAVDFVSGDCLVCSHDY